MKWGPLEEPERTATGPDMDRNGTRPYGLLCRPPSRSSLRSTEGVGAWLDGVHRIRGR
jgi:hypothetical protein